MAQTLIQRSRGLSPAEKATFHHVTGAGKSKVLRKFFGLSATDEASVEAEVDRALSVNLHREGQ